MIQNSKNNFIYIFIFSIFINVVLSQWGLSGHSYQLFNVPSGVTYAEAVANCLNLGQYLATITNQFEYNYLRNLMGPKKIWISSTQTAPSDGLSFSAYTYSVGPESTLSSKAIYDPNTDHSYTFSRWSASSPGFIGLKTAITFDSTSGYDNEDPTSKSITDYYCEDSPLTQPIMQVGSLPPTVGGRVVISNLPTTYYIGDVTGIFGTHATTSSIMPCTDILSESNTAISCQISPGFSGAYFFSLSLDNGFSNYSSSIYYHFKPPVLKYVYPSLTNARAVTIIGENFGDDSSKIVVNLTPSGVPCIPMSNVVKSFEGYDILICQHSLSVLTSFLPIQIIVNGVETTSYRVPLYVSEYKLFYSMFAQSSVAGYIDQYLQNNILNEMVPYISVPNEAMKYQRLVYLSAQNEFSFFQPVTANDYLTANYTITQGPLTGQNFVYEDIQNLVTTTSLPVYLFLSPSSTYIYNEANTNLISYLLEYKQYNPPQFIQSPTKYVPIAGGQITVKILNYGHYSSSLSGELNGISLIVSRSLDSDPTSLKVTIPPASSLDGPYSLQITVDGLSSAVNTQMVDYLGPEVIGFQSVDTSGGIVTITGSNFNYRNLSVTIPGCSTSNPYSLGTGNTVTFNVGPCAGTIFNCTVTVGNKQASFVYSSNPPAIYSILQNTQEPYLEVTGKNFGNSLSQILVKYNNQKCIDLNVQDTFIRCWLPLNSVSGNLSINVGGQETEFGFNLVPWIPASQVTQSPIPQGKITISGHFWSESTYDGLPIQLPIIYGITNNLTLNQTLNNCRLESIVDPKYQFQLTCDFPAYTGISPYFVFFYFQNTEFGFPSSYQSPTIEYATPVDFNVGGNVTISGSNYFSSIATIAIGQSSCLNTYYISPKKLICNYAATVPSIPSEALSVYVKFGDTFVNRTVFFYTVSYQCPGTPECSNNGICITSNGLCKCNEGYDSFNCSVKIQNDPIIPPPKPISLANATIVIGTSTSTTPPSDSGNEGGSGDSLFKPSFSFQVGISHIREVTFNNEIVNTLSLETDIQWDELIEFKENNTNYYRGSFPSKNTSLILEIQTTYYENPSTHLFAGEDFQISKNSMKLLVHISNYTFSASTNSLEVIYRSRTEKSVPYDCNITETVPTYSNTNDQDGIDWFEINAGGAIFKGCFAKRMIVDDRFRSSKIIVLPDTDPLYIDSNIGDSEFGVLTSMISPWFENDVYLDPNFSVLTTIEFSEKNGKSGDACDSGDEDNSFSTWKIITIVVCGGVTVISVAIVSFYVYYQKSLSLRVKSLKFSRLFSSKK